MKRSTRQVVSTRPIGSVSLPAHVELQSTPHTLRKTLVRWRFGRPKRFRSAGHAFELELSIYVLGVISPPTALPRFAMAARVDGNTNESDDQTNDYVHSTLHQQMTSQSESEPQHGSKGREHSVFQRNLWRDVLEHQIHDASR